MSETDEKAAFKIFVGIDISKEKFDASCIGGDGERLFRMSTSMSRVGFDELLMKVSSVAGPKESVLIGMESTACYHINLFSFLTSQGFTVIIINPLLISNFMKLQLRKTKTDKKDASVIAQFLLLNRDSFCQTLVSSDFSELRELSRQRESLVDQMSSTKKIQPAPILKMTIT